MRYLKPAAFLLLLVGSSVPFLSRSAIAADGVSLLPESNSSEKELGQAAESANNAAATHQSKLTALLDSAQGDTNHDLIRSVSFSPTRSASLLSSRAPADIIEADAVQEPQFSQTAKSAVVADSDAGVTIEITAQPSKDQPLKDMQDFRQLVQDLQAQELQAQDLQAQDSLPEIVPVQAQVPDTDEESLPTLEESEEAAPTAPPAVPPSESTSGGGLNESEESVSPEDTQDPGGIETTEPIAAPSSADADLNVISDVLMSDPNPLSVPVNPEAVDVDRDPLVTLDEAIQLAYQNNQVLQTSILQLEQAEAALDEAKASRLPSAVVQGTLRNQQANSIEVTDVDATFQINYDLLTGGSRPASIRAAELQQEVSALAVEAQQEQLRLVTANLYYALQESVEQIRINQSFVDEADRNRQDAELRRRVGVGTRFDVLRADVQLANAQQALVQAQFSEEIARRDIARLLNLPPTAGLRTTPVEKAADWKLDLEESILLAFENRAELEQQLNQAEISEQQREIALAAIRPQVNLFANYGLNLNIESPNSDFGDISDSTNFGVQLNWTLFNGGASRAAARQQEIGAMIAEEQFSETLDQIRFDVEQAFFNIQANDANIITSRSAISQAEAALELANLRLQAGVGTQLDVLSAQTELTQAQVNNVTAILGYNRALVAIERAISNLGF